mgnify:FL=1|tara:strand:- start:67 stop:606 length:540 start_codon:yes stop_codon:yes gene_type:complete
MDLAIVAQIITGVATFIVAIVLVFQLRKQNEQLRIQHRDSVREANYQIGSRFEDVTKETVLDESLADIWLRGAEDWNNLKTDVERYRFRNHYRQYMMILNAWYDTEDVEYPDTLRMTQARNMLARPGFAHCYKYYFKRQFMNKMDLMILWDNVYKEFYGEDISDFMPEQITTTQFIRED